MNVRLLAVAAALSFAVTPLSAQPYDVLIRGGTVIDEPGTTTAFSKWRTSASSGAETSRPIPRMVVPWTTTDTPRRSSPAPK